MCVPSPKRILDSLTAPRVWIIQECVVNQILILVSGRFSVGWDALHAAVSGFFLLEKGDSLQGRPALQRYATMQQLLPTGPLVPESSILGLAVML